MYRLLFLYFLRSIVIDILRLGSIIVTSSIMQSKQAKNNFRNSTVIALPEQFVTVEIQNHQIKRKYRHYRESIINEIKVTQDRVEETLNKCVSPPKGRFNYRLTCDSSLSVTVRKLKEKQKTIMELEKEYSLSPQVNKKLLQLSNISKHFHQACLPKEKPRKFADLNEVSYTLPVVNPQPDISPSLRQKDQMREQRLMVNEWRQKVKLGKNYVSFLKKRCPLKYKLRTLKFNNIEGQNKQNLAIPRRSLKSLRDVYFSPIKQVRKSTPAQSNNLSLLICQKKSNKEEKTYNGSIEQQQARILQQFIEGGALKQINEYTRYISIPQFLKSKQKFKTLDTIYNHAKDNAMAEFKDLSIDSFDSPSLLSVIYYVENGHNMTQNQKKAMRAKLKFSD